MLTITICILSLLVSLIIISIKLDTIPVDPGEKFGYFLIVFVAIPFGLGFILSMLIGGVILPNVFDGKNYQEKIRKVELKPIKGEKYFIENFDHYHYLPQGKEVTQKISDSKISIHYSSSKNEKPFLQIIERDPKLFASLFLICLEESDGCSCGKGNCMFKKDGYKFVK